MNNEEKILALLEAMQAEQRKTNERLDKMDDRFDRVENDLSSMKDELSDVKTAVIRVENELSDVKSTVVRIENDHGKTLDALYDGYVQNSDRLDRIKEEVTKREDYILRRVK